MFAEGESLSRYIIEMGFTETRGQKTFLTDPKECWCPFRSPLDFCLSVTVAFVVILSERMRGLGESFCLSVVSSHRTLAFLDKRDQVRLTKHRMFHVELH